MDNWTAVILKKKANWWGSAYADSAANFVAEPSKITYEIVNDWTTTITALKDEEIDIARNIRPRDFADMKEDERLKGKFELFTPMTLSYTYIGLNMKHPILEDKAVRTSLAHCVDRDQMIEVLNYGFAVPCNGPIHPDQPYYNDELEPFEFDLAQAAKMLDDAGWVDSDGDGVRDKIIQGQKTPLRLSIKYNSGNDVREKICLFLKENAKKVGFDIDIQVREWSVYLEETKNHDFDLYVLGWIQDASIDDQKQIWHTQSYEGGSKNVGFGDAESDAIIENIRLEMDETKRNELFKAFQKRVQQDVPYIGECMVSCGITKRFPVKLHRLILRATNAR